MHSRRQPLPSLCPKKQSYVGDLVLQRTSAETVEGYLGSTAQRSTLLSYTSLGARSLASKLCLSQPALEMWGLADLEPGRTLRLRIVDLACGCAIKSLTLAHANPMVQINCVDSPEVLKVARDLARRLGILSQVMFVPGDILTIDLDEGQYDAALLGQITHYFTPEQNIALFKRVHESLVPTGVLVIDAP